MDNSKLIAKDKYKIDFSWKMVGFFILGLVLVCGIVFLFNYNYAFDNGTNGGFIPPSFVVIFYHFLISVISIVFSICLKLFLKNRARLTVLVIVSILVPIICYNVNYYTLKKDGMLHFLVDDGVVFHFIVIGDWDLDGINDKDHHIFYEKREYSTRYGGHYDDDIIHYIDTKAIGVGGSLDNTFCFYDHEDRTIDLHLNKYSVEFEEIKLQVAFKDVSLAKKVEFYIADVKQEAIICDNIAKLVFDSKTCAEWQENIDKEFIEIIIDYKINE